MKLARADGAVDKMDRGSHHAASNAAAVAAAKAAAKAAAVDATVDLLKGTAPAVAPTVAPAGGYPAPHLQHLVLVAGHAVYTGVDYQLATKEASWFLEPYQQASGVGLGGMKFNSCNAAQHAHNTKAYLATHVARVLKFPAAVSRSCFGMLLLTCCVKRCAIIQLILQIPGQAQTFLDHIKLGIETAAKDPNALLLFSGGQTRQAAGPRSEGLSYWMVAEAAGWYGHKEVRSRAFTEVCWCCMFCVLLCMLTSTNHRINLEAMPSFANTSKGNNSMACCVTWLYYPCCHCMAQVNKEVQGKNVPLCVGCFAWQMHGSSNIVYTYATLDLNPEPCRCCAGLVGAV